MTEIKCRYKSSYCTVYGRLHHDEFWFCDGDEGCPISHYTRPNDAPKYLSNPTCVYCSHKYGEFAKYVKHYSYDSEGLTIGKDFYDLDEIKYLEIGGRVLIGGE